MASLKGRVWIASDTDGDGIEDMFRPFSDELATPYGLSAGEGHVDVVCKFALLRLIDADSDGRAERIVTLASGWGHTADYHDWAVGLPQDDDGCYYVGLPCQQDDRSVAAAHLRGRILRLVPREPTDDDPQRFQLHEYALGQRFPMGLAINRRQQLVGTDNQGNYNPFNELNHLLSGHHYGFINRLELATDRRAALTEPAINIPHPWTRSVNGICFLEMPNPARFGDQLESVEAKAFGPFAGHLIGCEYDTRRLVRMSLQEVDGKLQGAVYPLSSNAPEETPTFLGPIACAVAPDGAIYVGSFRESGWGGANNVGEIVRLELQPNQLPCGIREITAIPAGFRIRFTRPVDVPLASDPQHYSVASSYRISTPAYGGEDQDRRTEAVQRVEVAADGSYVDLIFSPLSEGRVYEFRLQRLIERERPFFPAEAFYTLRAIPDS